MSRIAFLVSETRYKVVLDTIKMLEAEKHDVRVYSHEKEKEFIKRTHLDKIDLLVTFDYMGYEIQSLTGGISLNFIHSKVLNFVCEKEFIAKSFLKDNPISISHFFYYADKTVMGKSVEAYPQIPFAKLMEIEEEDDKKNGTILYDSICEVLKMCHID